MEPLPMIHLLKAETVEAMTDERLAEAAKTSMEVRRRNSKNGALILRIFRTRKDPDTGRVYSWRKIEALTGIKSRTARRWAEEP